MINRSSAVILVMALVIYGGSSAGKPTTTAPGSSSLLDILFPPRVDQTGKSKLDSPAAIAASTFLNFDPSSSSSSSASSSSKHQRSLGMPSSSMFGAMDFSQITRLCEMMAASNRAKKMGEAVRAAANQPNDLMGWFQLVREVEPMPFETMACQMLERLITNPDEFVGDLLRMIAPQGATGVDGGLLPFASGQRKMIETTSTTTISTPSSVVSSTPCPIKSACPPSSDRIGKEDHKSG